MLCLAHGAMSRWFVCVGISAFIAVHAAASPLKYLSYYTFDFFKYGTNITTLGSANLAPPLNDDPVAAATFRELHGLPSMITPGDKHALPHLPPLAEASCLPSRWAHSPRPQAAQQRPMVSLRLCNEFFIPSGAQRRSQCSALLVDCCAELLRRRLAGRVPGTSAAARALCGQWHCRWNLFR